MYITAYFSENGSPKTGLSPTITIYDVSDNSVDVNAESMTEVGSGFYKYDFSAIDNTKDYVIICDGTVTLSGSERYVVAGTDDNVNIQSILTDTGELQTDWTNGGRLDLLIDAIKTKTDTIVGAVKKNVAIPNFTFLMVRSSDHVTPKTGLTVSASVSKNGAAFSSMTNSVSEISNGLYKINVTSTEMNATVVALKFTGSDADQRTLALYPSE